jgi:hypothetical protein
VYAWRKKGNSMTAIEIVKTTAYEYLSDIGREFIESIACDMACDGEFK